MKFASKSFRSAIYDLLTDNQLKEFHAKAFKYLENDSRRCDFCNNKFFGQLSLFRDADRSEAEQLETNYLELFDDQQTRSSSNYQVLDYLYIYF